MEQPLEDAMSEDTPSPPPADGLSTPAGKSAKKETDRERSEREKRTYRACLHCRQRKSRCDLYSSGEPGRPPCERCIREQHECVLGGSRRGGRRVKRTLSEKTGVPAPTPTFDGSSRPLSIPPPPDHFQRSVSADERLPSWIDRESRVLPPLPQEPQPTASTKITVDDTVAVTELQNPADALEFLAHVAERDSSSSTLLPPIQGYGRSQRMSLASGALNGKAPGESGPSDNAITYPPLSSGLVSFEMVQTLLHRYESRYHQFFPLANPATMQYENLQTSAAKEPHLLAAILTVASRDEKEWWHIHEACSAHMQQLTADLVYSGRGSVEAVEAMLILAEWVPRRAHATPAVGRGEEDYAAWMFTGTAIRLGYLLGIDRTGFRAENDVQTAELNRKRLAWAACYMSDRQISVRLGKAFWSRGPGPMTGLRAEDFPSLASRNRQDNFAAIFQANLELTQLFSNAHDVLYATKGRSYQLHYGGEYVKYADDLRTALQSWHSTWGVLTCSPPLKASLTLSFEYLRLYVNAFAYQATLNRMKAQVQAVAIGQQTPSPAYPFGSDLAATPDARFIYDSIEAAKALLSTFNSFIDPSETFRFMPLRYYLYVIYSACFLYKARATGVMGGDRTSVKRMISDTIDRLQQASACPNDLSDRYSRLIKLLWRKPPVTRASVAGPVRDMPQPASLPAGPTSNGSMQPIDPALYDAKDVNAFSWLDLGAVGDFALTNNDGLPGGLDAFESRLSNSPSGSAGFPNFDPNMMMFNWNHGSNGSDIIF